MLLQETLSQEVAVKRLDLGNLKEALRLGWDDFRAAPTHLYFLALFYPVVMFVGVWAAVDDNMIPLLFPLLSGAALLGPFSAIVLYEMSRQREQGESVSIRQALRMLISRAAPAIAGLAIALVVVFGLWIWAGIGLYHGLIGVVQDRSFTGFFGEVLSTSAGWSLILIGVGVGFLFALAVLACFGMAFQAVVDQGDDPFSAVWMSLRVFCANPLMLLCWGAIVVTLLAATVVTLFAGLAVALPLLGHASWHLYRQAVPQR